MRRLAPRLYVENHLANRHFADNNLGASSLANFQTAYRHLMNAYKHFAYRH